MEAEWASHAFQTETTVLRLRLRPFSVGHEILLSLENSPYLVGGKCDWHDLLTAALICSQDFKGGLDLLRRPWKAKAAMWIWRWVLRGNLNVYQESVRFRNYLEAGTWSPDTNAAVSGISTRELKAPRPYRLIPFLCRMGMTEAQALDFPLARAQAYAAAMDDKEGQIDLTGGSADSAVLSALAAYEARAAKGEKVWD